MSIRNTQKDFTTRENILPSQGCRCYLSNRPAILLAQVLSSKQSPICVVGGWGEEKVRGGQWERTPSAYRFLIVLFLLEYSAGGSVEKRGLTRYKHGWVAGRTR